MPEYSDQLIGWHCDESVHCNEAIFKYDDNGDGLIISEFCCGGCNKRVKVKTKVLAIYDVNESLSMRSSCITANEEE